MDDNDYVIDYRTGHDRGYKQRIGTGRSGWDESEEEYDYIIQIFKEYYTGKHESVLELGCGMGNVLRSLKGLFAYRHGIDISIPAIEHAMRLDKDATYECRDISSDTISHQFNLVLDSKLLHCIHPRDRQKVMVRMRDLLTSDGMIMGSHMIGPVNGLAGYDEETMLVSNGRYFNRFIPPDSSYLAKEWMEIGMTFSELRLRHGVEVSNIEYSVVLDGQDR